MAPSKIINFLKKGTSFPLRIIEQCTSRDLIQLINCQWVSCSTGHSSMLMPGQRPQMRERSKVGENSFQIVTFQWEINFIFLQEKKNLILFGLCLSQGFKSCILSCQRKFEYILNAKLVSALDLCSWCCHFPSFISWMNAQNH